MDCVVGFILIPGCWIVLLGCVNSGCIDLVAGFVFLVFCRWVVWIVLLGYVDSGCVDLVARFVFLVFCRWVVWIPV